MNQPFALAVFSTRRAQLEDARAIALEIIEKQLVTEETAAEFRLIDFLAEGFAEFERRYRSLSFEEKVHFAFQKARSTPEEHGQAMAPAFFECLKSVADWRDLQRSLRTLPELFD